MTVTATAGPGAALPNAAAPSFDPNALASLVTQLQQLTDQLAQLTQQLAAGGGLAGAAQGQGALGGGPTASGCSCTQGMQGAASIAPTGGASYGAPIAQQPETVQQPKRAKRAKAGDDQSAGQVPTAASPQSLRDVPKPPPFSYDKMLEKVKREVENPSRDWHNLCLGFAARAYGWQASGTETAYKQWQIMPDSMKHKGDTNPPPGALVFWYTGEGRAGHVAVYLGDGKIASNDIRRDGKIDIVPMSEISQKWGAKYLGWTPPYFENAV